MIIFYLLGVLFVMVGGWVFISNYNHLLIVLLSLEVMMLGLYSMVNSLLFLVDNGGILLIFLGFAVCEGSVGLGLLVSFVRMFGSDYISNFSSLWC